MATERFAISMDAGLAQNIREAAERDAEGNVSAWLAKAAARELRRSALRALVAEEEARNGPITEAEMAEIRRRLDRPLTTEDQAAARDRWPTD
jgi:hypothetical protein